MPPLAALERFFERLFERPTARFFRTRLQPVQLQRRIERAMESERLAAADRTLVPNRYVVHLNPDDLAAFGEFSETLATELAEGALLFARSHRYTLVDRPRVDLVSDPTVARADIVVQARFADPTGGRSGVRAQGAAPQPDVDPDAEAGSNNTMVFQVPRPAAPHALLRLITPGGAERQISFDGGLLTVGRATDNGLVLGDSRASRHHGRFSVRRGALVYTDLQSTNGSRVNGDRVDEVVLGAGDRIEVGDSVIVVDTLQLEAGGD